MLATLSSRTQASFAVLQLGHQHGQPAAAALDHAEDARRVPFGLGRDAQAHLAAGLAVERGAPVHARRWGTARRSADRTGTARRPTPSRAGANSRVADDAEPVGLVLGVARRGQRGHHARRARARRRRRRRRRAACAGCGCGPAPLGRLGRGGLRLLVAGQHAQHRLGRLGLGGVARRRPGWLPAADDPRPRARPARGLGHGRCGLVLAGSARSTPAHVSLSSSSLRMWPRSAPRWAPRSAESVSMAPARRRATSAGSAPNSAARSSSGTRRCRE